MKRYKSCNQNDSECNLCSSMHYGLDCHNVPVGDSPKLRNTIGYPLIYADINAMEYLINVGDFTDREIAALRAAIALVSARNGAQLTQEQAAEWIGTTRQTLAKWEAGITSPTEAQLQHALECL